MWGNLTGVVGKATGVVGKAIQNVKKFQSELESQLDAAVGKDDSIDASITSNEVLLPSSAEEQSEKKFNDDRNEVVESPIRDEEVVSTSVASTVPMPDAVADPPLARETEPRPEMTANVESFDSSKPTDDANKVSAPDETSKSVKSESSQQSQSIPLPSKGKKKNKKSKPTSATATTTATGKDDASDNAAVSKPEPQTGDPGQDSLRTVDFDSGVSTEHPVVVSSQGVPESVLKEMSVKHETLINSLKENHAASINELKAEFELKLVQQAEAHRKALDAEVARRNAAGSDNNSTGDNAASRIIDLEAEVSKLTSDLIAAKSEAEKSEKKSGQFADDVMRLKEVVSERERALETAAKEMAETHSALEDAQKRISDLTAEIAGKDASLRQSQSSAAGEGDVRKQLQRAQELAKEREERLAAFEHEGKNLAKKQSDMEKEVRKCKQEVKQKETEIAKLKESKEQLVKAIEELQDLVRKNEAEANSASKSLSAMQAVSQASTDKLARLEADISAKVEELASQRRAMEAAWTENNELKRSVAELRAERDDLRRQIGEGTSKVMETESSRRDVEQREAVLRATNKQLQDSLQRQMQEASVREERLRDEVSEMRKRWQEAVSSRETLSSELSSATAPLLRQISSLQEGIRAKAEAWQAVETSLGERALRAESVAEAAERKRILLEDQVNELKQQVALLSSRLQESQAVAQTAEGLSDKLRKLEAASTEKVTELESRLALEAGQRQSLQSSLRELELRQKLDLQESKEAVELAVKQSDLRIAQLKAENDTLREEIASYSQREQRRPASKGSSRSDLRKSSNLGADANVVDSGNVSVAGGVEESAPRRFGLSIMPQTTLPSGELSYAASERIQQQLQQREEEVRSLAGQIHQLQVSRDALLEEVNFLSMRNAQMEEQLSGLPNLKQDALASRKRVDVLLEIVGEKEEEIEAVMADLQEVKNLYRGQIEELMDKVLLLSGQDSRSGPGAGSSDIPSVSSSGGVRGAPFGSMTQ